ncbi:pyridoxine 4-dehydrogenase [Circinella umbellata]|nr:pyridoxine 4-dehydrogenase [Circinella umbellata]
MEAELRKLGNNPDALVSPIGLGCMNLSEFYGPQDDEASIKVLERAVELGCTFWDTADVYGVGHNEKLLSQVLKTHRDKIFLCTKFGFIRDEAGFFVESCGKPEYVRKSCQESLDRLGVDTIDLYYMHRMDKNTPIEETMTALVELVKEGKIRHIGLSEFNEETIRRAHKIHPISALQVEYSPWFLNIEKNGILKAARELGISIVAFSPLGRAIMTGDIKSLDDLSKDDARHTLPRFYPENFEKNLKLTHKFKALADKKNVSPSEYVLAWILAQGPEFLVIPGTRKINHLEQNLRAGQIKFTPEELMETRKILNEFTPVGDRFGEMFQAFVEDNKK